MAEQKNLEQAAQPHVQHSQQQPQQDQPQPQQPVPSPAGAEAGSPASPAGAPGRHRDDRRVLSGVQMYEPGALSGNLRTYTDSDEDKDALEEVMTKEQYERLKKLGALEGEWSPRGTPPPPMRGSDLHQAQLAQGGGGGSDEVNRLRKENEEMRAAALATVQRHREEADANRAKAQLWDRQEAERQRLAQAERAANEPRGKGK